MRLGFYIKSSKRAKFVVFSFNAKFNFQLSSRIVHKFQCGGQNSTYYGKTNFKIRRS